MPPAASIFSSALPQNMCAVTVSALVELAARQNLQRRSLPYDQPVLDQQFGVINVSPSKLVSVPRLTTAYSLRKIVKSALRAAAVQRHLAAFEAALP